MAVIFLNKGRNCPVPGDWMPGREGRRKVVEEDRENIRERRRICLEAFAFKGLLLPELSLA